MEPIEAVWYSRSYVIDALDLPELPDEAQKQLHPLESLGGGKGAKPSKAVVARFGGKAATLADLRHQGFPVPAGWVIDASTFAEVVLGELPKNHDIASLIKAAGTQEGTDRSARARDRILGLSLPAPLHDALHTLADLVGPESPWGFSVRSSATSEDARTSSLAGLATSVLGVRGGDDLEAAVKQVWASLYLPRTLLYLQRWGIKKIAMPVLIMPMVEAKAAGVLFTAPPPGLAGPRWAEGERLVHATLGLGAPVVDGATVVDTVRLTRGGGVVEQVIADKPTEFVIGPTGLVVREVEAERRTRPSLSLQVLSELSRIANFLVDRQKAALDVEFAVMRQGDHDRVVLLQARPVTGGLFPDGGDENTVWSRANVGEALPGAATPLTWSVAKRFSDSGFRAAFAALGCKVPKGDVLVANVYGRFYLNLTAFMNIAAQVPGLSPRALLEQSGGAPDGLISILERTTEAPSKRRFLLRAPFTLPSLVLRGVRLPAEVDAFELAAEGQRRRLLELDLAVLPDDALAQTLDLASDLLVTAGELMLTCASASLATHLALKTLLRRLVARREGRFDQAELDRETSRVAQALTGGIAEIESANPGLSLLRVANVARAEPEALSAIRSGEAHVLSDLPAGPTRAALLEFVERFGDRAVKEAELSTPRWREDSAPLLSMLAAALRGAPIDPDAGPSRARLLADRELASLETLSNVAEVALLKELVGRVQTYTRLRERMRAWVTRTLGLIRLVALDVDRRLRHIEPSLPEESVFFCTYSELKAALRTGRAEVAPIIRLRRAEHLRDKARPDPPPTFVGRPPAVSLPPSAAPKLLGLAASAGVVEGIARVVGPGADPATALCPGEILVARTTDIGMSPLFLVAAAVVTELGGPLSHAAIVAREYNVPAVVNVDGCTLSIRTGERLRVDGDRGTVERLSPRPG
jgi:phosphohistidine swiveling domain-containing protein